jgi:hypothetical protein
MVINHPYTTPFTTPGHLPTQLSQTASTLDYWPRFGVISQLLLQLSVHIVRHQFSHLTGEELRFNKQHRQQN